MAYWLFKSEPESFSFADLLAEPDQTTWLRDQSGGSAYLRLSTRPVDQPRRKIDERLADDIVNGGYWMRRPGPNAQVIIAYTGATSGCWWGGRPRFR